MLYKPTTKVQLDMISMISSIILSWRNTNDISSPTIGSDIYQELSKIEIDHELKRSYIREVESTILQLLSQIRDVKPLNDVK